MRHVEWDAIRRENATEILDLHSRDLPIAQWKILDKIGPLLAGIDVKEEEKTK
ncbi:MAG TPA: hypothetical protein VI873_04785 [Candidatus Peribacteraceae bacterium]|nr:hypothetical protein [Candidatus Peribacteraceae bacterium]